MSKRTFQRQRETADQIHPGQYIKAHDCGGGLATLAIIRCPKCERAFSINRHDENPIDEHGRPRYDVPCKRCGTMYEMQLEDWSRPP